jgi:hypothetical protein
MRMQFYWLSKVNCACDSVSTIFSWGRVVTCKALFEAELMTIAFARITGLAKSGFDIQATATQLFERPVAIRNPPVANIFGKAEIGTLR